MLGEILVGRGLYCMEHIGKHFKGARHMETTIRILVRGAKSCGKTSLCAAIKMVASNQDETVVRAMGYSFNSFLVEGFVLRAALQMGDEDQGKSLGPLRLEIIDTAGFDLVPAALPSAMTRNIDAVLYLVSLDPQEIKGNNSAGWCRIAHEPTCKATGPEVPCWLVGTKFDLLDKNKDFQTFKKQRARAGAATAKSMFDDAMSNPDSCGNDEELYFDYLEAASRSSCEIRAFCEDCKRLVHKNQLSSQMCEISHPLRSIWATSAVTERGVRTLLLQVLKETWLRSQGTPPKRVPIAGDRLYVQQGRTIQTGLRHLGNWRDNWQDEDGENGDNNDLGEERVENQCCGSA